MKIHHIGYVVANVNEALLKCEELGYSFISRTEDKARNVVIVFVENCGVLLELIAPLEEETESSIDLMLNKNGSTPHHICYEVNDINDAINRLKNNGFILTKKIAPAPAIGGNNVAFLYNNNIGIVELAEIKQKNT